MEIAATRIATSLNWMEARGKRTQGNINNKEREKTEDKTKY